MNIDPTLGRFSDYQEAIDEAISIGALPYVSGKRFWVEPNMVGDDNMNPYPGSPNNDGSLKKPFSHIVQGYDALKSGRGDGLMLLSNGTTTTHTTSYLTAPLTWAKFNTTVFGVCAPVRQFHRARVANTAALTDAAYLLSVTGDNNRFINFCIWNGGATAVGNVKNIGHRNFWYNMHIAGSGVGATISDCDIDLTTGRDGLLRLCTFGADTYDRGDVASANVLFSAVTSGTSVERIKFERCDFISKRSAGTTAGAIKIVASNSITRDIECEDCGFHVYRDGAIAAELGVVIGVAPNNGFIVFTGTSRRKGYVDWKDVDSAFGARVVSCVAQANEAGGAGLLSNAS